MMRTVHPARESPRFRDFPAPGPLMPEEELFPPPYLLYHAAGVEASTKSPADGGKTCLLQALPGMDSFDVQVIHQSSCRAVLTARVVQRPGRLGLTVVAWTSQGLSLLDCTAAPFSLGYRATKSPARNGFHAGRGSKASPRRHTLRVSCGAVLPRAQGRQKAPHGIILCRADETVRQCFETSISLASGRDCRRRCRRSCSCRRGLRPA